MWPADAREKAGIGKKVDPNQKVEEDKIMDKINEQLSRNKIVKGLLFVPPQKYLISEKNKRSCR